MNTFNPDYTACKKCEPIINGITDDYKEAYQHLEGVVNGLQEKLSMSMGFIKVLSDGTSGYEWYVEELSSLIKSLK